MHCSRRQYETKQHKHTDNWTASCGPQAHKQPQRIFKYFQFSKHKPNGLPSLRVDRFNGIKWLLTQFHGANPVSYGSKIMHWNDGVFFFCTKTKTMMMLECVCVTVCVVVCFPSKQFTIYAYVLAFPSRSDPGHVVLIQNRSGWELSGWPSMFGRFRLLHRFGQFFGQRFLWSFDDRLKWLPMNEKTHIFLAYFHCFYF